MEIVSVNVALPKEVEYQGKRITTSFYKQPRKGPVRVLKEGLEGNDQADKSSHGGMDKAVYAYSYDHYPFWQELLGRQDMPCGLFGENLTIKGLSEEDFCIGDQLQVGDLIMAITQPRVPCFKLGIRLDDPTAVKTFMQQARTGFYLKVLQEGEVQAGDSVQKVAEGRGAVGVNALFRAYYHQHLKDSFGLLNKAMTVPELSVEWRKQIERHLWSCSC